METELTTSTENSANTPRIIKKKLGKAKKRKSYPTRCQWVGEMYCLFLSCWKKGRFPICSIGPSWGYTIGLMMFAFMCLTFLIAMLINLSDKSGWMMKVSIAMIAINLMALFGGIFGDPGVKAETYLHYTKNWFSGGKDLFNNTSDEESEQVDEEAVATRPKKRSNKMRE